MNTWYLQSAVLRALELARSSNVTFTAEQRAEFAAVTQPMAASDGSRIMTVVSGVAGIQVRGVLTDVPDMFAYFFGGGNTTYPEIDGALAEADADKSVDDIEMVFDTPGGTVAGMFNTIAAMQSTKKTIRAVVASQAQSAGYAIASQADSIVALSRATQLGSIGIAADYRVREDVISIASTHAPNKRPDLTTEEGKSVVREELDALHELFAEAIAAGRGTTVDNVNAEYGQGGTLLADAALKRGMIDEVAATGLQSKKPGKTTPKPKKGKKAMDITELLAAHPALYAQVLALGVTQGTTAERDRVSAHVKMGDASGDMETAMTAVTDGSAMTALLQATYMAAGMNRGDANARDGDNPPLLGAADEQSKNDTADDKMMSAAANELGVEI